MNDEDYFLWKAIFNCTIKMHRVIKVNIHFLILIINANYLNRDLLELLLYGSFKFASYVRSDNWFNKFRKSKNGQWEAELSIAS